MSARQRAINELCLEHSAHYLCQHFILKFERIEAKGTTKQYQTLSAAEYSHSKPNYHGPGSVVGTATDYGLDGQGIESR
jgi:hypothetical protein